MAALAAGSGPQNGRGHGERRPFQPHDAVLRNRHRIVGHLGSGENGADRGRGVGGAGIAVRDEGFEKLVRELRAVLDDDLGRPGIGAFVGNENVAFAVVALVGLRVDGGHVAAIQQGNCGAVRANGGGVNRAETVDHPIRHALADHLRAVIESEIETVRVGE